MFTLEFPRPTYLTTDEKSGAARGKTREETRKKTPEKITPQVTPRHIIKLMAELVQPQLGHHIADPACGTGGFLLGAFQYIVTQLAFKKGAKKLQADEDGFKRTSVYMEVPCVRVYP
jgi:hypothetical protein